MRVVSCVNQKGGVGKTTICVNLAAAMSRAGCKVLAIDMDPQAHLSQSLGVFVQPEQGVDAVLQRDATLGQVICQTDEQIDLVPAGQALIRLESVQMQKGRGLRLKRALSEADLDYDVVLIDCPPSSGFLVVNSIAAASELLLPVTPDYLGLSGLSAMMKQIKRYETVMGGFRHIWVVISRAQKRRVTRQAMAKIEHYFSQQCVPVTIHERAVLAECPGHGRSVIDYAPRSPSSKEFEKLAGFLMSVEEDADDAERCA